MLSRVYSASVQGLSPIKIEVEVDAVNGTPCFLMIGLPTKEVDEAKERISSALQHCGIRIRAKRTVVNLAPADLRKSGSTFELAIAVGVLQMYGELHRPTHDTMFFGELALDGQLKSIRGALPLVLAAKTMGFTQVVIPIDNQFEVSVVEGILILCASHLQQVLEAWQEGPELPMAQKADEVLNPTLRWSVDFCHIAHQEAAKRALEIAAAGAHNLFMVGPPGSGKTMLAQALVSILPPLSQTELIEVLSVYSIAGLLQRAPTIQTVRPFRSPHHTTSTVGLTGGGLPLMPGEVSLAHRGVLFLDEFPEFSRSCLEALRQPLEDKHINITRAHGTYQFPAQFTLVASANPCPCGFAGSTTKACRCSPTAKQLYSQRVSGPLLDRIDLRLWVPSVPLADLSNRGSDIETSQQVASRVSRARQLQLDRLTGTSWTSNSEVSTEGMNQLFGISTSARALLERAGTSLGLSARAFFRTLKVARTIADLGESTIVETPHIAEALQYRQLQWGQSQVDQPT